MNNLGYNGFIDLSKTGFHSLISQGGSDLSRLMSAMTVKPPTEIKNLYSDFIDGCKSDMGVDGVTSNWDSISVIRIDCAHTRQAAYLNVKNPSQNIRAALIEEPGFVEYYGLQCNGASGVDTNFNPSSDSLFLQNSASIYVFIHNNSSGTQGSGCSIGAYSAANSGINLTVRTGTNIIQGTINGANSNVSGAVSDSRDMTGIRRSGSANFQTIKASSGTPVVHATTTAASISKVNMNLYDFCLNNQGTAGNFDNRGYYAQVIGNSNIDYSKIRDRIHAFKTGVESYANDIAGTTLLIDFRGQSNCSGAALISDIHSIDSTLTGALTGCKIYKNGAWETLDAGINNALITVTQKAGLELSLMKELQAFFGEDVYMVKTDYAGTQLAYDESVTDWSPLSSGEHFDTGNTRLKAAVDLLISQGKTPRIFKLWYQGENDANNATRANAYDRNLRTYINRDIESIQDYMRENHPTVKIPFIKFGIQEIFTQLNGSNTAVRTAQLNVSNSSPHYKFNSNAGLTSPDTVHLDAQSYIDVGNSWSVIIENAWP